MSQQRFTPIAKFNINDIAIGNYYESVNSGLNIMVAEIDGPKIDAYIAFGTKVEDNTGVAHTLEHLVFCGSKKYPYKGILDSLANRCFAQGTNAWTCIDSTVYTLSTVSQEGFINILPVYMDHIFNPIITDETFSTEVYNKNEMGEEGGVVFSEMQAKEKSESMVSHIALMKSLFQSDSGYPFNSGGSLKYIRTLTVTKIIEFHKKFYRPENCLIVVVGSIESKKILDCIEKIENEMFLKISSATRIARPWINNKIEDAMFGEYESLFISQNKNTGNLIICSPGPSRDKISECQAFNVLASYLTFFEKSPLKKIYVTEEKLCKDITYEIQWYDKTYIKFHFYHVEVEDFEKLINLFKNSLKTLFEEGLDRDFLMTAINYEYSWEFNNFEKDPHGIVASRAIDHFLYGQNSLNFINIMEKVKNYKDISQEDDEFWKNMLANYYNPDKLCIIKSKPISRQKLPRQETSIYEIDETKEIGHHLKLHNRPSPELMEKFPIPSIESINFHHIKTICNFGSFTFDDISMYSFDLNNVPLAMQADHIQSNTLTVTLCVCLGNLKTNIRHFIPLAAQFPLEMPIVKNGVLMPHSKMVKELNMIFYHKFSQIGWSSGKFNLGILPHYFFLSLKTDIYHYEDCVTWIRDLIFNNECDIERLRSIIIDEYSSAKNILESGSGAVNGLSNFITFKKDSINYIQSLFPQIEDLRKFYLQLKKDSVNLINEFKNIRNLFRSKTNVIAHMMCNFQKLCDLYKTPHSIWQQNFSAHAAYESKTPLTPSNYNYEQVEDLKFQKKIIGLSSIDSSFLIHTMPSIQSYRNPDFPGLLVLLEYLSAFEGPLWKNLRGNGLAYNSLIFCEPSDGLIYFKISKSVDIFTAYKTAIDVFTSFIEDKKVMTDQELDSAISGAIFEIVNQETDIFSAGFTRIVAQLKGYDYEFHKDLINNISKLTLDSIHKLTKKYLSSFIDPTKGHIAISCPLKDQEKIVENFKTLNIELEIHKMPEIDNDLMKE